ncbi:MAG: HAMP domain-containing protein [Deltaproteobacteria bacterium]|nr:HAMP domain-containing protein [Deltaproteobacteria bacterium]
MVEKKFVSISSKITAASVSVVLVSIIVIFFISVLSFMYFKNDTLKKTEKTFEKQIKESLECKAVALSTKIKITLRDKICAVGVIGECLKNRVCIYTKTKNPSFIEEMKDKFPFFHDRIGARCIALYTKEGLILKYPSGKAILPITPEKIETTCQSEKGCFIDFHINKDGEISYGVTVPIICKGRFVAVLFVDFDPDDIYAVLQAEQPKTRSEIYAWMINKEGVLIFDPPTTAHELITLKDNVDISSPKEGEALAKIVKNYILKGKTGSSRYIFRGVDKFVGYSYIKETGWGIGLTYPTRELFMPVNDLKKDINERIIVILVVFSLFSIFTIFVAVAVSFWLSKRLTKPMLESVNTINRIIEGDISRRLKTKYNDEIGALAGAVNRLMDLVAKQLREKGKKED